jgi:phage-related protein
MDSSLQTQIKMREYGMEACRFSTNEEIQNTAVTWQGHAYGILGHMLSNLVPLYAKGENHK